MFGQLSGYGETGHSGHGPSLSDLHWNQRWICCRCGCVKEQGQKIFLPKIVPIITKANLDNLQWLPNILNVISVCHVWSFTWITNESCIHCSLPSHLPKLAKSGTWHCHLQWQCARSCVTYMMHEWYQWNEDELLLIHKPNANIEINLFQNNGPLNMDYLFFYMHCI